MSKGFLLKDLSRGPDDLFKNSALKDWAISNRGRILCDTPPDQHTKLDFTGRTGQVSGLYYSLVFQLRKWGFSVLKADEHIEVSPIYTAYYGVTIKQKEDLEGRIKAGLASAAQAVSDYELLKHDERKYQEFLDYTEHKDEHSLRSVFIDQVDVHTGDTAIRNIISRWPTLISDFMKLDEKDTDPGKVKDKLKISKAEAIVLVTKNKLFQEWKTLFEPEVSRRLNRIRDLIKSRETSVKEYREWLKPYIMRHKLLKQSLESEVQRKMALTNFVAAGGHATSASFVELYAFRDFAPVEFKKTPGELFAEAGINPYDDFVKEELIWHPEHGLVVDYPWITEEWLEKKVKEVKSDFMTPGKLYYSWFYITLIKANTRLADGTEIEDGIFDVSTLMMSQNAHLVKMLEMKAREDEVEHYIDNLLGIQNEKKPLAEIKPKKKLFGWLKPKAEAKAEFKPKRRAKFPGWLLRPRPYESDFEERLTKFYMKPMGELRYGPLVGFLQQKMGIGQ